MAGNRGSSIGTLAEEDGRVFGRGFLRRLGAGGRVVSLAGRSRSFESCGRIIIQSIQVAAAAPAPFLLSVDRLQGGRKESQPFVTIVSQRGNSCVNSAFSPASRLPRAPLDFCPLRENRGGDDEASPLFSARLAITPGVKPKHFMSDTSDDVCCFSAVHLAGLSPCRDSRYLLPTKADWTNFSPSGPNSTAG
jgi:hypothetical protein